MLLSPRFAKDELFVFTSFDYLSVPKMYTQVGLKCRGNPGLFERYSNITERPLLQALKDKKLQRQGRTTSTEATIRARVPSTERSSSAVARLNRAQSRLERFEDICFAMMASPSMPPAVDHERFQLPQHGKSDITSRAASFLDDYLFRSQTPNPLSLYEYAEKHFRRKRTETAMEDVLFLSEHPLFGSHCVWHAHRGGCSGWDRHAHVLRGIRVAP
jgi:hypothetical protein